MTNENVFIKEFTTSVDIEGKHFEASIPFTITMEYRPDAKKPFGIYCNDTLLTETNDAELFISEAFNLFENEKKQ